MKSPMKFRIKIQDSEEMQTLRNALKTISSPMSFRYRVRERKNKSGAYASVSISRAKN